MLNFCDFIQVYVFTTNHHLNLISSIEQIPVLVKFLSGQSVLVTMSGR